VRYPFLWNAARQDFPRRVAMALLQHQSELHRGHVVEMI
jgi:hypothetical protein